MIESVDALRPGELHVLALPRQYPSQRPFAPCRHALRTDGGQARGGRTGVGQQKAVGGQAGREHRRTGLGVFKPHRQVLVDQQLHLARRGRLGQLAQQHAVVAGRRRLGADQPHGPA